MSPTGEYPVPAEHPVPAHGNAGERAPRGAVTNGDRPMRFAYADPPYIGCADRYPEKREVDHAELVERLVGDFPDGWALSCLPRSLRELLPLCPVETRIAVWVKPFVKSGGNPIYSWEAVLFVGGRGGRTWRGKDSVVASSLMGQQRTILGQKPPKFCRWLFTLWGARPGDELVDMFPGSGAVTRAWGRFVAQRQLDELVVP